MSLKLQRMHRCGYTNLDFRSKGDFDSLKLYEPWQIPKEFGTMGKSHYYPSFSEAKKIFSVSKSLNKLKNIVQGSPDPKSYPGALYYKKNNMKPNIVQEFRIERVAELDESEIGKEKYIGDSMMIADINKYRRERKNKKVYLKDKVIEKKELMQKIEREKSLKNKESTHETQLVKIEAKETLDNKIDLKKVQEIRLALRRRYANRTDFRKIFKEWDLNAIGEITVYSAHDMINRLNIPINYNETRALIASSNKRGTESLNLEEFMHLIFSDNEALKVDLDKFEFKDEKLFSEGIETENVKNNLQKSIIKMNKNEEILTIKQHLHTRTSIINLTALNNDINKDKCTKEQFKFLMQALKFPEKYYRDILMDTLFNSYINEDKETMNMTKLCEDCLNMKEENNFSDFKERILENFKGKLVNQEKNISDTADELKTERENRKDLVSFLSNQIEEKKDNKKKIKELEEKIAKEILNPQPSTAFINKVFKDHKIMFQRLNKAEQNFVASQNISLMDQYKTRFNGNPKHKDTFYMINQDPRGSSYISEKERFNISSNNLADFIRSDKEKKRLKELAKLNTIRKYENMRKEACKTMEKIFEQRDISCQNKRAARKYEYELLNQKRNEFVE
jgi:hypothetical protein